MKQCLLISGIGANASWAITPLLAVNGSIIAGFGESLSRGESTMFHSSEFSVEADLLTRTKVPLGFKFAFISSSTPGFLWGQEGSALTYDLIMAYTQSNDFRLSLETYQASAPFDDLDGKARFGGFSVNLHYYFN